MPCITAADLEHSFGPAHARGVLSRGTSAWSVIAVNSEELQPTKLIGLNENWRKRRKVILRKRSLTGFG